MRRLLIWSLALGSFLSADSVRHSITTSEGNTSLAIHWELSIPSPRETSITSSGVEYPGWNTTVLNNGIRVPVQSRMVYTRSGPPVIEYALEGELLRVTLSQGAVADESAKGIELRVKTRTTLNSEIVNLKLLQSENDYQLWAVNVLGGEYNADLNQWGIPEGIRVTIHTDVISTSPELSNGLELNQAPHNQSPQVLQRVVGLGQGRIKLSLLKDGIYRVYYDSLAQTDDFPDEISSRSLKLFQQGEAQPIHVTDGGDGIFDTHDYFDFIGKQKYFDGESQYFDAFSDINVYWLDWGGTDGLRFVEESGALVDLNLVRPNTFWDVSHIEQDIEFERLGQVDTDKPSITRDHYFWESVNSGATKEVAFNLKHPFRGSSENLEVSLGLHGLTYSETAGEVKGHTLFAFMNDQSIGSGSWIQQEEYILTSPAALNLSHNILSSSGSNTLAIFAPVSTEAGNYDKIVLNWMEIGYEHLFHADEDQLRFRKSFINPSTNLEYEIQGFQSHELVLYKEGLSKITGFTIRENWDTDNPEYSLVFQDHSTPATPDYWSASVEGILQPIKSVADTSVFLRELDGDFIVITIPKFMGALEEYLDFKRSEGWNPIAVSIADIYDEFNWGIHSPYAIKSFLKYANNHWPSSPEYAVLIGDAISNPQQTKRDTRILNVPTFYMQTYGWGAAEADYWFSLINGDDYIPDINIGRIPASDREGMSVALNKLINYGSAANYGSWQNELVTIAGFDTTFKIQTESILDHDIPDAYMPSRIFIDRDSEGQVFWGDTDSLVAHWNRGKLLINFLGHGGGAVWADRSLFVRDDINYLDADTPPAFVTSMTCFTASFAQTRGLGEVVLTESPTGAIGWFGSSGVGWIINDYLMIQPLLRRLLEDDKTVGEIINLARMEYFLANSGYDYLKPSMLFQYNFLGDPTTRLLRPELDNELVSQKPVYGQSEQIKLTYQNQLAGDITLLPINAENHPWWSQPQTYPSGINAEFIIDQESSPPAGIARSIYTIDRGVFEPALQGRVSYSISTDWFEHTPPTAESLSQSEHIPIEVKFHSTSSEADSMVLVLNGSSSGRHTLISQSDFWILSDTVRISAGSGNTYYSFYAFSNGAALQNSQTYRLYLPKAISLIVSGVRSGAQGNNCGVFLDYRLEGLTSGSAQLLYSDQSASYTQSIDSLVVVHEGANSIFIQTYFDSESTVIDASLQIGHDLSPNDNTVSQTVISEYYQILPGIGLTYDGHTADTLDLWSQGKLLVADADSTWIRVAVHAEQIQALPGVVLYQDSTVYSVETPLLATNIQVKAPRQLFCQPSGLSGWQFMDSNQSGYYEGIRAGYVSMGQKQNFTGPEVSMMIEGQLFFDGDYLLASSHLNLLAEDENGFSWESRGVEVLVDAAPVEIQIGDTTQSGQIMSISAALEMDIGEHQISYRVCDALGNWSEEVELTGVVAGDAEILDYGNFPNPFEGETLIIYELTQPLDDVVIDIYTLSGYKVHTIDAFTARVSIGLGAIGYHEVPWNGRDRYEDFVANGVYFYRIKGSLSDEDIVGPIGKMVKNR